MFIQAHVDLATRAPVLNGTQLSWFPFLEQVLELCEAGILTRRLLMGMGSCFCEMC